MVLRDLLLGPLLGEHLHSDLALCGFWFLHLLLNQPENLSGLEPEMLVHTGTKQQLVLRCEP